MSEIKYLRAEGEFSVISGMPITSNGGPIPLCVLHQLNPNLELGKASSFVIGGLSVCVEHLDVIAAMVAHSHPLNEIIDAVLEMEMGL